MEQQQPATENPARAAAHPAALAMQGVSIGYAARRTVATGLSARLHGGQLCCLLGANGAGKSTLLRTLAAFQPPLEGSITLQGRPLGDCTPSALARQIAIVLTGHDDLPSLTVYEVAAMGRVPYTGFFGRLSPADRRVVDRALQLVGMHTFARRRMAELSDGERQKTLIAKALAQQTPIVLLDEPTAFLDYPSKVEMLGLLRQLAHAEGKAVLISTHDLELALQLTDSVWLMQGGHLVTGSVEQLSAAGELSRFIDRDGITFNTLTKRIEIDHEVRF